MLMDNTLELLGITDSNIKITRFSAESVNGEKRNVIEARLTYNVDRCPYCESERGVRNGSKILKAHWRLFHKDSADLEAARSVYLRGVNEYMTQQNALDLIVKNHPQFEKVYDTYQDVFNALKEKNRERLIDVLENYRRSGQNMDTAISTLKKNMTAVLNSVEYDFSKGPVEGINRRIKSLKRSCFGFRNLDNFRKRIALIRS